MVDTAGRTTPMVTMPLASAVTKACSYAGSLQISLEGAEGGDQVR